MQLLSYFLTMIMLWSSHSLWAKPREWLQHARRLSGESDSIRNRSIQALRKMPHLENALRSELRGYQVDSVRLQSEVFLALDVISTLKLSTLIPDLLTFAEKDTSGYSVHALNSLITKKNIEKIVSFYQQFLNSKKASPAMEIAILDTFARLQVKIDSENLSDLFESSRPQVQAAILGYLRGLSKHAFFKDYVPILKLALESGGFQIKMQTLYLISEIGLNEKSIVQPLLSICSKDSHQKVQKFCQSLRRA